MLALGLVLNTVGLGLFCWLIFALAVYAVPFFVAVSIGMLAFNNGAGVVGAVLVGTFAGASTLVLGQIAFAMTRSTIVRAAIGTVFAVPAAIAGYHVILAMAQIGVPSLAWREVFACLGAVSVGATAWVRLTIFAEPRPLVAIGA
ncbi:hypothetical protein UNPF46_30410 [Bradyrhizobium sp. UNPF46]|uniref:hypothetical protein n=1 Tax=Bradyrhizobium sp. UNPF46 TaxID=1141168 RepID=UPI0011545218|nr:hypothetical protein [Bradyrhizobium sp. UNPF46]TQF27629.1 hypothetical protein UNPF46_30410 [Bradyrhizobium sp. UNPF46]